MRAEAARGAGLGFEQIVESPATLYDVPTVGRGPAGRLPLTAEMLRDGPSGVYDVDAIVAALGRGAPREEESRR